jgi:hypothetical protein
MGATPPPLCHSSVPSQSRAVSEPQLPSPIASLKCVAALPPKPGSINDILRQHCRARLYVRPIAWTHDQLRLLGCQFAAEKLRPRRREGGAGSAQKQTTTTTTQQQPPKRQQDRVHLVSPLQHPGMPLFQQSAVRSLLQTYHISPSKYVCAFSFLGRKRKGAIHSKPIVPPLHC